MKSDFDAVIEEQIKDPRIKQAYDRQVAKVQIARLIFESRTHAGLSQEELAELIDSKQSVISRLESVSNDNMPNVDTLIEIVHACNKRLVLGTNDLIEDVNVKNERYVAI